MLMFALFAVSSFANWILKFLDNWKLPLVDKALFLQLEENGCNLFQLIGSSIETWGRSLFIDRLSYLKSISGLLFLLDKFVIATPYVWDNAPSFQKRRKIWFSRYEPKPYFQYSLCWWPWRRVQGPVGIWAWQIEETVRKLIACLARNISSALSDKVSQIKGWF